MVPEPTVYGDKLHYRPSPGVGETNVNNLVARPTHPGELDHTISDDTRQALADAIPPNTSRAYARIWDGRPRPDALPPDEPERRGFTGWCELTGRTPMPATPETLAEYVRHLTADRGLAPATVEQAIAGIRTMHRRAGYGRHFPDADKANLLLRKYRRDVAGTPQGRVRRALPVLVDALNRMVRTCETDECPERGARDHALILLGVVAFGRRSEIAAFTWDDLRHQEQGLALRVAKSKTDQAAQGETVPILYGTFPGTDPVAVLQRWRAVLAAKGLDEGPILRRVSKRGRIGGPISARVVNDVVQYRAALAHLPPGYSAHSLRAGGATIAHSNGATIETICRLGRWKLGSPAVLGYIREVDQWKNHPFQGVL